MILLVLSFGLNILNCCLPDLMEKIVRYFLKAPPSSISPEIESLKDQQDQLNVKDDFAKYAKLQREINKIKEDHKTRAREIANAKWKYGLIARYGTQFLMMIISMVVFWNFLSVPVVILKEDWLEPVSSILSWPTHIPGALSFPVWYLMCGTVVKLTLNPQELRLC